MNNFNIKQYLAEGRLLKEGESKKVTKDMWKIMSKEQKTDAYCQYLKTQMMLCCILRKNGLIYLMKKIIW